jgi:hypothetical protein
MDGRGAGGALKGAVRQGRMTAAYDTIGLLTAPMQTEGPMRLFLVIAAAVVVIALGYTVKTTMFSSAPANLLTAAARAAATTLSPHEIPVRSARAEAQSRQKSLNRFGASAVQTAVLVIDRCPSHPWIARVSCPCCIPTMNSAIDLNRSALPPAGASLPGLH